MEETVWFYEDVSVVDLGDRRDFQQNCVLRDW
jgi:hypothetical protein